MSVGHWLLSRTGSMIPKESGCVCFPGLQCGWCSQLFHQSQASSLTLLAQGFFHVRELLHQIDKIKRKEVGQSTQWAACNTHFCTVCQNHQEERKNHHTSCQGGCFGRMAPFPLRWEVSIKCCGTPSDLGLYFGFKPLQILHLQAQKSGIHVHLSYIPHNLCWRQAVTIFRAHWYQCHHHLS